MIHRIVEDALKRLALQFPVVGVTEPRQSGKTTLAKAFFPTEVCDVRRPSHARIGVFQSTEFPDGLLGRRDQR